MLARVWNIEISSPEESGPTKKIIPPMRQGGKMLMSQKLIQTGTLRVVYYSAPMAKQVDLTGVIGIGAHYTRQPLIQLMKSP